MFHEETPGARFQQDMEGEEAVQISEGLGSSRRELGLGSSPELCMDICVHWPESLWLWLSKPMGSHFGVGEFTTHFRTYFSGDWDVH